MASPTPFRPDEEIAAGFLTATLGGQVYRLPVLPRRANREWQAGLTAAIKRTTDDLGPIEGLDDLAKALAATAEDMMDLLIAYDVAGAEAWDRDPVLPDREWIDTHATDRECYEALKQVAAASYPFGFDLLRTVPNLLPLILDALTKGVAIATVALSRSTSSLPPSTGGGRRKSKAA